MGLAVSKSTHMTTLRKKTDTEFKLQQITFQRSKLAEQMGLQGDGAPDAGLKQQDQQLEQAQKMLETILKILQTYLETIKKLVDKEVDLAFKGLFG